MPPQKRFFLRTATSALITILAVVLPVSVFAANAKAPGLVNPADKVIRIKAAATAPHTDETGVVWLSDEGLLDGETTERSALEIKNTKTPSLYLSERFSMTKFSKKIPNGKYIVKLHFAETYEGITGPGQRVFTFNVEGHEFKNFDIWVKSGGALSAYIETVPVTVTGGQLDITFTSEIENPQINAIEIIPGD